MTYVLKKIGIVCLFLVVLCIVTFHSVRADELSDITNKLSQLTAALSSSEKATATNERQLATLTSQLDGIKAQVAQIEKDIVKKESDIKKGEEKLVTQKALLDERVASFYKNQSKAQDAILQILVSDNLSSFFKQYTYQQNLLEDDRNSIVRIVLLVKDIEEKKLALEDEKMRLIPIKEQIDAQSKILEGEVQMAKQYQQSLKSEIVSLTTRQREILSQRLSGLNLPSSLGAGPLICTDDRKRNPGFGNAYAFYSFGIPHRVGMSQYGAYGRAKAGQKVEEILNAYYGNIEIKKDYDQNITINVDGYGPYNIEEYVKRIYEVPESWPIEALKAQAIAARSYALAYTNNGQNSICTTQSCQVFKPDPKTGAWAQAVEETKGWVMTHSGSPITAWYASTAGGYTFPNNEVWGGSQRPWTKFLQDGSNGYGSFQDVINNAYDKESPCIYAAQGWRSEYDNSAWLKSEEVADIANVIMLVKKDSSAACFVFQPDKSPPAPGKGCPATGNWNPEEVRNRLGSGALTQATTVEISGVDWGKGATTEVKINGISFSGSEFKDYFNQRAPANLQIVGPLFNVERR